MNHWHARAFKYFKRYALSVDTLWRGLNIAVFKSFISNSCRLIVIPSMHSSYAPKTQVIKRLNIQTVYNTHIHCLDSILFSLFHPMFNIIVDFSSKDNWRCPLLHLVSSIAPRQSSIFFHSSTQSQLIFFFTKRVVLTFISIGATHDITNHIKWIFTFLSNLDVFDIFKLFVCLLNW